MRRIRLPMGRGLFFACAFLFAVVALLPLRVAIGWMGLDSRGLAAREANGSLWFGVLSEAQFGALTLGDLTARLRTLPLLAGRARLDLQRHEEARPLKGALDVSRHGFGLDDVTGILEVDPGATALPIASIDLDDLSARFSDGLCRHAEGLVKARLAGEFGGMPMPEGLSGNARCEGGALLLPLASRTGLERLNLRLFEDGRFRAQLMVRPSDPAAGERLRAAGFAPAGPGYAFIVEGSF
jgi:general secretion pathway protein N